MSGDTTVNLSLIIACISAIGVIYSIYSTRKKDNQTDTAQAVDIATKFTELNVKLDLITKQFNDLIRSNEKEADKISAINHSLLELDSKIERLFEYKDNHEERIKALEEKKGD